MRDSEEPFPGHSAIVESLLPSEYYVEAPAELVSGQPHDLMEGIFEERSPRHGELDMRRQGIGLTQVTELRKLPSEGSLILGWHSVSSLGTFLTSPGSRVIKGGGPGVVVHEVSDAVLGVSHLPAGGQWLLLQLSLCPGVLPLGGSVLVIDKVDSTIGLYPLLPAVWQGAQGVVLRLPPLLRVEEALVLHLHDAGSLPLPGGHLLQPVRVRALPGGLSGVVIHVVDSAPRVPPHLPARGQRLRPLPGGGPRVVVHVVPPSVLVASHLPAWR